MAEHLSWHHHKLATNRLEALTDGVFAFAMTLLVLNLQFPDSAVASGTPLSALILDQLPRLYNYFLSFVLLAIFWIIHNQHYHHIRQTDRYLLWINIGLLSCIALIPFSTDLVGDFGGQGPAEAFFAANMFMIGFFFLLSWAYAAWWNKFTELALEEQYVREGLWQGCVVPAVSLLAFGLAFVAPGYASYSYLLIPLLLTGRHLATRRRPVT